MDLPKEISILFRKMNMELNDRLGVLGISHSQNAILRCLNDHGEMTQSDLCHYLDLDKSTIAKALLKMEEAQLVQKHTNPRDIRSFLVSLTPESASIVSQSEAIITRWGEELTATMTDIEKEAFCKLIVKAAERSREILEYEK